MSRKLYRRETHRHRLRARRPGRRGAPPGPAGEAEALAREALAIRETQLGPDHGDGRAESCSVRCCSTAAARRRPSRAPPRPGHARGAERSGVAAARTCASAPTALRESGAAPSRRRATPRLDPKARRVSGGATQRSPQASRPWRTFAPKLAPSALRRRFKSIPSTSPSFRGVCTHAKRPAATDRSRFSALTKGSSVKLSSASHCGGQPPPQA